MCCGKCILSKVESCEISIHVGMSTGVVTQSLFMLSYC